MKIRPMGARCCMRANRRTYGRTERPTWRSKWSFFV